MLGEFFYLSPLAGEERGEGAVALPLKNRPDSILYLVPGQVTLL